MNGSKPIHPVGAPPQRPYGRGGTPTEIWALDPDFFFDLHISKSQT